MSILQIDLYDEETETGAPIFVEYSTQPAEPEVGISVAYGEIERISMWIPAFGSISFYLSEHFIEEVEQAMDDQVWENELARNQ